MKRVLVFGTFDGLHKGHIYFLEQAKKNGDELFAAVARDSHVFLLKDKTPRFSEQERLAAIKSSGLVTKALLCDVELNSFEIIKKIKPDVIIMGHDQSALANALHKWMQQNRINIEIGQAKKNPV
jgi:cytidyltransferase-like protein